MNLNEYQLAANSFAAHEKDDYAFAGLVEEVGEISGKIAKFCRKNGVTIDHAIHIVRNPCTDNEIELRDGLFKELGDALWFLSRLSAVLGFYLDDVASGNIEKLADRQERGVLIGEGDSR